MNPAAAFASAARISETTGALALWVNPEAQVSFNFRGFFGVFLGFCRVL